MADEKLFPDDLILQLRQIERRLRALESANPLQGGSFTTSTDERPIVAMGDLSTVSLAGNGIVSWSADRVRAMLYVTDLHGFGVPWLSHPWVEANAGVTVTSGTFTPVYSSTCEVLWSTQVMFRVAVVTDGATTGELQVTAVGGPLGVVKAIPAGTGTFFEFRMIHGIPIGGGPVVFGIEARRTSGAGVMKVFEPGPLNIGVAMAPVAGGWV